MTKTLIIFRHEVNKENVYCWNGLYPVGLMGGYKTQSDPWDLNGQITEEELELFKKLERNKARGFETKDRGRFIIIKRLKIETDDEDKRH